MRASSLSERSQSGSACHRDGRSLNDIRETRSMREDAQLIRDKADRIRRLRYERWLGLK